MYDVIGTAAHNFCSKPANNALDEGKVRREMMELTIAALRRFVNDEINELDFGLRVVAGTYLKPGTGLLFVITHSPVEEKIAEKTLKEVDATIFDDDDSWCDKNVSKLGRRPWDIMVKNIVLKQQSSLFATSHP